MLATSMVFSLWMAFYIPPFEDTTMSKIGGFYEKGQEI